jgi:hypothetical protein
LDDIRSPTGGHYSGLIEAYAGDCEVCWVKTVPDFKEAFMKFAQAGDVELAGVFFDNDLGRELEGRHAFNWMEEYVREHNLAPFALYAQTANLSARRELNSGFKALRRFWDEGGHP